jgi:hypothetical protein
MLLELADNVIALWTLDEVVNSLATVGFLEAFGKLISHDILMLLLML